MRDWWCGRPAMRILVHKVPRCGQFVPDLDDGPPPKAPATVDAEVWQLFCSPLVFEVVSGSVTRLQQNTLTRRRMAGSLEAQRR